MYRVKSNAVWHSLPGVVAAFQPISAPDPFAARQNVAHGGARFGVYTATPGVEPTFYSRSGWNFVQASSTYLATGITPTGEFTVIVRLKNAVANTTVNAPVVGSGTNAGSNAFQIIPIDTFGLSALFSNGSAYVSENKQINGVLGISGRGAYINGILQQTIGGAFSAAGVPLFIGAHNNAGTPGRYATATIQAIVISSITLSSAQVWLASRQMAYCERNPDWNAWARRRRYYYAPSQAAAAFNPAWARNANTLIGGGFD